MRGLYVQDMVPRQQALRGGGGGVGQEEEGEGVEEEEEKEEDDKANLQELPRGVGADIVRCATSVTRPQHHAVKRGICA